VVHGFGIGEKGANLAIIRLEARFQPNVGFTLRRILAVFTRLAITPPNVN